MWICEPFSTVVNMSLTGSVVIGFVLLARLGLRRAPKVFSYALWSVVLFRLLCPVSLNVDFSVLSVVDAPAVVSGNASTVEFVTEELIYPGEQLKEMPAGDSPPAVQSRDGNVLAWIWIGGGMAMIIWSLWSLARLGRKTAEAARLRENIYEADGLDTAFVMGLIRPRIYLPSGLTEAEREFILLHEGQHLKRCDHGVKLAAFLALCLHWFNPLVWLAFYLAERDMEMSCDEAVLAKLGRDSRCDYAQTLLRVSSGRRWTAAMPLAFGEGNVKERVKYVLKWKKPRLWVRVICGLMCVVLLAACGGNPGVETTVPPEPTEPEETTNVDLELMKEDEEQLRAEEERRKRLYENTVTVKVDLTEYANIQIELPESWDYEILEYTGDGDRCGIRFWPEECPEGRVGLYYYPTGFGVCGTGLEEKTMTTDSGKTVTVGYYDGSDVLSFCAYWGDYAAVAEGIQQWPAYEETMLDILLSAKLNQDVISEAEALERIREEGLLEEDWEKYRAKFDPVEGVWTFTFYEKNYNNPEQLVCVDWDGHCYPHGEEHPHHSDHH